MSISRLRCWKASGCAFHRSALFLQRFANALRDHCRIVVESKYHRPLESLWAGDEDAEAALERIRGDPRFVRATRLPAAADHGPLDAITTTTGNAFDVEDRDRHTAYCSEGEFQLES